MCMSVRTKVVVCNYIHVNIHKHKTQNTKHVYSMLFCTKVEHLQGGVVMTHPTRPVKTQKLAFELN